MSPTHDQIEVAGISVDVGLSMLLQLVWKRGITTTESCQGDPGPAYVVFPLVTDGAEFLLQSAHLTDYRLGDQLALTIVRPVEHVAGVPRSKVSWLPEYTPALAKGWMSASA